MQLGRFCASRLAPFVENVPSMGVWFVDLVSSEATGWQLAAVSPDVDQVTTACLTAFSRDRVVLAGNRTIVFP
jgi:hypothetical protein